MNCQLIECRFRLHGWQPRMSSGLMTETQNQERDDRIPFRHRPLWHHICTHQQIYCRLSKFIQCQTSVQILLEIFECWLLSAWSTRWAGFNRLGLFYGSIKAGKLNQAQINYLKWFWVVFEPRSVHMGKRGGRGMVLVNNMVFCIVGAGESPV